MKIKHWQGYGNLEAKKLLVVRDKMGETKTIKIEVIGNHEYGLNRSNDKYDVFNWLLKRFDRSVKDYTQIKTIQYEKSSIRKDNCDVDKAIYTITYSID